VTWNNTFYSDQNDETFLFLCAQSSHLDPFFRHSNEKIKKKGKRKRAGVPGDNNSSSSSFCVVSTTRPKNDFLSSFCSKIENWRELSARFCAHAPHTR